MVGMPVATLRVWEQRYQAVQPTTAPSSGHRLYSLSDIERVTLLRRLSQQGHAIALLACLDNEQLRQLIQPPATDGASPGTASPSSREPMKIVVVGQAMAQRLKRLTAAQHRPGVLQGLAFFDSLSDALQAAQVQDDPRSDLLLWQASSLQTGAAVELRTAQLAWRAQTAAVVYRHTNAAALQELVGTGAVVAPEPTRSRKR